MTIDAAFSRLTAVADEIQAAVQNAKTEQDARLQIIDRILTEILGWRLQSDTNRRT